MKKFFFPFIVLLVLSFYGNNLFAYLHCNENSVSIIYCSHQSDTKCTRCNGTGKITCPVCNGTGISGWTTAGGQRAAYGCEKCGGVKGDPSRSDGVNIGQQGSGKIKCPDCNGTGETKITNKTNTPNKTIQSPPSNNQDDYKKALEDKQRKEQAEIKRRQEEFERSKQEALKSMKGITENELGIKGIDKNNELGLKGVDANKDLGLKDGGDANVVDLRHLDPNKPITVDPNVVKGKERVFPVQPNPATFENTNYNKGFEALRNDDPNSALRYFENAKKERPNDPLVHNALLLVQDLVKVHEKKEQTKKDQAVIWKIRAYLALMSDEPGTALAYITHARDLNPKNSEVNDLFNTTQKITNLLLSRKPGSTIEERAALRIAASSGHSIVKKKYSTALSMLEVAQNLSPNNVEIKKTVTWVKELQKGQNNNKNKEK